MLPLTLTFGSIIRSRFPAAFLTIAFSALRGVGGTAFLRISNSYWFWESNTNKVFSRTQYGHGSETKSRYTERLISIRVGTSSSSLEKFLCRKPERAVSRNSLASLMCMALLLEMVILVQNTIFSQDRNKFQEALK